DRGELVPGSCEPWVLTERQALVELYLGALRQLCAAREGAGDLAGALAAAREAVSSDPLQEEAHYDVMRLAAALGQPTAALRQYQELERVLREELGETPSAEARALAEELRPSARTLVLARPPPPRAAPRPPGAAPPPGGPAGARPPAPRTPGAAPAGAVDPLLRPGGGDRLAGGATRLRGDPAGDPDRPGGLRQDPAGDRGGRPP